MKERLYNPSFPWKRESRRRSHENGEPVITLDCPVNPPVKPEEDNDVMRDFQIKKLSVFSFLMIILLWTTFAFSYDIQTLGNIPLADTLTGISINPSTNTAAAISRETKTLYFIDTQTNTITKKISLEITPSGIAVDTNRNQVIVSSSDGILQFIDLNTGNLIKSSQLPNFPTSHFLNLSSSVVASQHPNFPTSQLLNSIAINSKTDTLYIANDNSITLMDLTTGDIIKEASLPDTVTSMAIDPNLGYLVIIMDGNVIARSETPSPVIARDEVPKQSQGTIGAGSAISKDGIASPLVRNDKKGLLYLYNAETLEFITEINPPSSPFVKGGIEGDFVKGGMGGFSGVAVNPSTHIAVLTNPSDNSITVVSLSSCIMYPASCISSSQLPNLSTSQLSGIGLNEPTAISIDPLRNIALIAHKDGIAIIKLENPVPKIDLLVPSSARSGDSGFMLSIEGSKFVKDSQAQFNREDVSTYFLSNEKLQAGILWEHLTGPGDVPLTVINPSPGGGISNTLMFKIYNPAPVLESILPDTISLSTLSESNQNTPSPPMRRGEGRGEGAILTPLTLRVRGKNFFNGSIVNLNGENLKTKFISSILLEAEITPSIISSIGKYPVVVINPSPGAYTSNPLYLNVVEETTATQMSLQPPSPLSLRSRQESGEAISNNEILLPKLRHQNDSQGAGTLTGRILNTKKEPIEGVTIKIKNISTKTDSNGYFILENVPAGKRHLMIRGMTAKDINSRYPTIPLTVNIQADMINEMPFQIYLHKQKNKNFKDINPNEDTILTDPEVPGFELRIPKGVNITGWDGNTNKKVSVRTVPIDRLPVKPLPPNANVRTVYMFYFDKEGGGIPDQPIPIKSKNDLGLLPGEKAVLWYYDESPNEGEAPNDWAIAGTGTVTPDGKYIISDPGVGIPKFCCGATAWGGTSASTESSGDNGSCGLAGDPVDVATGYFIHEKTDLQIPGIIPVNITRYYRSRDSGSAVTGSTGLGAFGKGMYLEYDWWLGAYDADGNINNTNPTMFLLIKPGNYQYRFDVQQTGGTFINDSDPAMAGAVITRNADSTKTLKMRDGWTYKFDSSGDLIEIADRNSNKLTLTRHSDFEGGYIKTITTPEGREITFNQTYTGAIFRTDSIVDSTGRTVTYTYETDPFSSYPRLKKVTYPDGASIEYQYDSQGRMSGIKNERGLLEVFNEYDENNRVITQTHADGGIYTFSYTIAGGNITETSMTTPNGAVTTWRFYDDAGNFYDKYIVKKITPDGSTIYDRELSTNLLLSVTDPLNRKMTYTYYPDASGQTHTVTDNLNNTTTYEYEPVYGLPSKITDANLKDTIITYTYDANNKITKIETQDPLLKKTTVNFNTNGMPTDITDPNLNTTWFFYENAGKPAELTKVKDMLNNTYSLGYDALGRLQSITDAKGKTTTYTINDMDRITEVKDPLGFVTRYGYGDTGNLIAVTDAKNQTIRYEYDERDRIKKMTDQLGRIETYTYDTSDNLVSMTDRKGQVTTFNEYDSMNRVKKITYHDGSVVDYIYDAVGRLTSVSDSVSGSISYTYSDTGCTTGCSGIADKIIKEVTPFGTIDYTYDNVGRRKTMTVAGQPEVSYSYDDNSRLTNLVIASGAWQSLSFGFTYDNAGRRTSLTLPNGVTTNYTYDNANRLLNLEHLNSLNQVLESLGYTYDANGNRITMNRPSVTLPMPNAVSNTSYNEANQMLTFNDKNIVYDNNGNMTSVTNSCGTTNYTWDVRNRLTAINGFKSDCSPLIASFKYDALNRRIEKTINGITTKYLYDEVDIIQELNQDGTIKANYIRGLNIDEHLARIKADGTIRNYLTDALGSVIALTDENGVVKTTYSYDPFGNVTITGEISDNPFQFAGRENDGTGLLFERNRYYSYELLRYISEDPIRLAGGDVNFYVRVGNNPVNFIDPLGLFEFVYEAGGSIWFPGSAGAYSGDVGSKWKSPYSEGPRYRGYSDNFTIASLADIGARAGIKGLSGCNEGRETSLNIGLGKYLGFQMHFKNGRFDGITTGFGIGLSSPVTYSIPFKDFISIYR